ncbi:MAG: class I SAM-dependent methyltransferase [Mycobacterium sp.]
MARSDDDTWDLASSVGATATMVAAARAMASREPAPLINDPFAEPLVRAVGVDFFRRWASGELDDSDPETVANLRQMADWMAARTWYFDRYFADAMAAGVRQVVILASGLDSRAYRLPWPAGTTVFEIDQPQVVEFKNRTLAELGAEPTAERRAVAVDLRQDWPTALRQQGFAESDHTAWLVEGLLRYLPPAAQGRLLDQIGELSAVGSWFAGNAPTGDRSDADRVQTQMHHVTDSWQDHGFDLDVSDLAYPGQDEGLAGYLNRAGWQTVSTTTLEMFAEAGVRSVPSEESPFINAIYVRGIKGADRPRR